MGLFFLIAGVHVFLAPYDGGEPALASAPAWPWP